MPYIICVERDGEGNVLPEQRSLAERAHHPDELTADCGLAVDVDYYLAQQVSSPAGILSLRCYQPQCDVGFTRQITGHQGMRQPVCTERPIAQPCRCGLSRPCQTGLEMNLVVPCLCSPSVWGCSQQLGIICSVRQHA